MKKIISSSILALGAMLALPSFAQYVPLADQPLATQRYDPITLMMDADDSVSMTWYFAPEGLRKSSYADKVNAAQINGDGGIYGPNDKCATSLDTSPCIGGLGDRIFFQNGEVELLMPDVNWLSYNPDNTYTPPMYWNGSQFVSLPSMSYANTGGWTKVVSPKHVQGDPYQVNLTTLTWHYSWNTWAQLINSRQPGSSCDPSNGCYPIDNNQVSAPVGPYWCGDSGTSPKNNYCPQSSGQTGYRDGGYTFPPFYFRKNPANGLYNIAILDFKKGTATFKGINAATGNQRTDAQELENYANWAAYYRNRVGATKTAASLAFAGFCPNSSVCPNTPYVGFTTLNALANPGIYTSTTTMDPAPYTGAKKMTFFDKLFSFQPGGPTPTLSATYQLGEKFRDKNSGYIRYSCQRSYHVMFTDGLYSDDLSHGSYLGCASVPSKKTPDIEYDFTPVGQGYISGNGYYGATNPADQWVTPVEIYGAIPSFGGQWPPMMYDIYHDSNLSDIALRYWVTNLRPDLTENKQDPSHPFFNVRPAGRDNATWPHLNFYAMGFAVAGTLPAATEAERADTEAKIAAGTLHWPAIKRCDTSKDDPTKIDDLWHAAINGMGKFIAARNGDQFRAGMESILSEITNLSGSRGGAALVSPDTVTSENFFYVPSFGPEWSGDVKRYRIDQYAQFHDADTLNSPYPTAADLLNIKLASQNGKGYASRVIFTKTGNDFSVSGMSGMSSQLASFGNTTATQNAVINYLRGDNSNEGDNLAQFRKRGGPLGDIVNASPVVVAAPQCAEDSNGQVGCAIDGDSYKDFYNDEKNRGTMVYVAANDGMLHAFDEKLNELWAFVPTEIMRPSAQKGLVTLSLQPNSPTNPFTHYYYVNATPFSADAQFDNGTWHTMLVGGLGKGGTSYYALDVTQGANNTDPSKIYLWEFTHADMGYSFGQPLIARTKASSWKRSDGGSKWVAILPSGYNNGTGSDSAKGTGSGKACLFFIDIEKGTLLKELCSQDGLPAAPLNLAQITAFVEDESTQVATAVYGGDNAGNVWRFNLESSDPDQWKAEKFATLQAGQYVTTRPFILLYQDKRYLALGTGGYRNKDDLTSTVNNSFYVFVDGDGVSSRVLSAPLSRGDLVSVPNNSATGVHSTLSASDKKRFDNNGWYMDMPEGYQITIASTGLANLISFGANHYRLTDSSGIATSTTNPCGESTFDGLLFARDVTSGDTFFKDNNSSISIPDGISSLSIIRHKDLGSGDIGYGFFATDLMGNPLLAAESKPLSAPGGTVVVPHRYSVRFIAE
jgi:type IV pilus assembly protein PilY1